ncbi:hypothetical protein HKCCE2091_04290 [Rhodobacterales bacterium HKCCE2091]|nr:hypothetical protein [Rhodobacterales bacterium HKCCE2091]
MAPMQRFFHDVSELNRMSGEAACALAGAHGLAESDPALVAFQRMRNHVGHCLETTSQYLGRYPEPLDEVQRAARDARLRYLGQALFVGVMSNLEQGMRATNLSRGNPLGLEPTRADVCPFGDLMKASAEHGMIPAGDLPLWATVARVRNRLIHFGGEALIDGKWEFPDGLTVETRKGEPIGGALSLFPRLTRWTVAGYSDWCGRMHAG